MEAHKKTGQKKIKIFTIDEIIQKGGTLHARISKKSVSTLEFETFISQAEASMRKYPDYLEDNNKVEKLNEILRFAYYYHATKNFSKLTKDNFVPAMESAEKYLALYPVEPKDKFFLGLKTSYTKYLGRYQAEKNKIELYTNVKRLYDAAIRELAADDIEGALDTAKRAYAHYPKDFAKTKHAKDDFHRLYGRIQDLLLQINVARAKLLQNSPARGVYRSAPKPAPRELNPTRLSKSLLTKFSYRKNTQSLEKSQPSSRNKKFTSRKK